MLKRIAVVTAALAALAIAPAAAQAQQGDIVETASSAKPFSTLVELVQAADLVETLQGEGPYTVLAPTNKAFRKVPDKLLRKLANRPALLRKVLLYHVIPGEVPASEVVKLRSAETAEGSRVHIRVRGGKVRINRSAKVTKTDIEASNGVIHAINRVLLPPSL